MAWLLNFRDIMGITMEDKLNCTQKNTPDRDLKILNFTPYNQELISKPSDYKLANVQFIDT